MVQTSPSNMGVVRSIPGQGVKIPGLRPKHQNINNRSNIVTNSIKTFKVVLAKQTSKKVDQDKKENKWQVL